MISQVDRFSWRRVIAHAERCYSHDAQRELASYLRDRDANGFLGALADCLEDAVNRRSIRNLEREAN